MREERESGARESLPSRHLIATNAAQRIRDVTWTYAGIVRNADGLKTGIKFLNEIQEESNLLTVARIIHEGALAREESRGAHYREDFPARSSSSWHSLVKIS